MKKTVYFILTIIAFIITSSFIGGDDKKKKAEEGPTEIYTMGEVKVMTPDSVPMGTYVALTKEIMNKKENTITMKTVSLDQKGEVQEYNYVMNLKDPTFTIQDVDSNFTGTGKLHGAMWKWTSWSYTMNFTNPVGKMEAYNYISMVGLVVNKAFYGPDGKMTLKYKERHKFISKEQFEILYLQALKCSTRRE